MAELLTPSIAYAYNEKAKALPYNGMQDIGERRRLRQDLQERCGITELEAINIINGFHIDTYCMNHMDNGINEAMIIANMAIVQLLQHQKELENTYFEVGSVEVKSKETYPFNTEKVTVALKDARNTLNYIVLAFCDNLQQGRAIRIKDKQLNGFKIEVEDCPTEPVTIKYFIFGGKI